MQTVPHMRKFGGAAFYYQSTELTEAAAKGWAEDYHRRRRGRCPPMLVRLVKAKIPGRRHPVWHVYVRANPRYD